MASRYICSGAKIKCSCGDKKSSLQVYSDRTVNLTSEPMANEEDYQANKHIFPFGKCSSQAYPPTAQAQQPMPCNPGTIFRWCQCNYEFMVRNHAALTSDSFCLCQWGGTITFVDDGQTEIDYDIDREPTLLLEGMVEKTEELAENVGEIAKDVAEGWTWLDTVELVPVVGSIVGMGRAGMNGNWGMAALNAGFLVADVAGLVSFGSTTVASTAAKATIKAGLKAGTKTIAKQVSKESAKIAAEKTYPKLLTLVKPSKKNFFENIPESTKKEVAKYLDDMIKENKKQAAQTIKSHTGGRANERMPEGLKEGLDKVGGVLKREWEKFKTNNEVSSYFRDLNDKIQKIKKLEQDIKKIPKIQEIRPKHEWNG